VATVRQAAEALVRIGVTNAMQISVDNADMVWNVLTSVPGLGYATANYFLMLLEFGPLRSDWILSRTS
jgi:hypothetical protein